MSNAYLIIGATGGIGQAVCRALAESGARLVLCGRNEARMVPLQVQLGDDNQLLVADINSAEGRSRILDTLREEGIDKVINLAGVNQFTTFAKQSDAEIEALIQTNLTAVLCLNRLLVAHFLQQGHGLIVNTGSALGQIGLPGYVTYSATKFALRGFCEALSRELADSPVAVKYFSPRATDTAINSAAVNAMNRELGNKTDSPEQVASELLIFLQNSASSYQVGWPEKLFTRLNGAFPGLVSRQLKQQLPVFNKYLKSEVS